MNSGVSAEDDNQEELEIGNADYETVSARRLGG